MTQRIIFAKIFGQGDQKTTLRLLKFLEKASIREVEDFLKRIRGSSEPPLLFFCESLDYWSSGEIFSILEPLSRSFHWTVFDGAVDMTLFYFLPLQDKELFEALNTLKTWPDQPDETRWFLTCFEECLSAWEELVRGDRASLLIRLVADATLLDDEIRHSKNCHLFS